MIFPSLQGIYIKPVLSLDLAGSQSIEILFQLIDYVLY